jgi:flagellar biosynthesis/type III secretory pathway chaperone
MTQRSLLLLLVFNVIMPNTFCMNSNPQHNLAVPAPMHDADHAIRQHSISIKTSVCTENIALDLYKDSKGSPIQEILNVESAFKAKGLVPVWIEITNTTDSTKQIINQSSNTTQQNKKLFFNCYRRSPIWRFISMFLLLTAIFDGFVFHDFKQEYQKINTALMLAGAPHTPWNNLSFMSKLTAMSRTPCALNTYIPGTTYAMQAAIFTTFSALINLGGWWLVTDSNKRLDTALDKLMLQEQFTIEPGQTVKKLVILGAEKKFVLDIVDYTKQVAHRFEYIHEFELFSNEFDNALRAHSGRSIADVIEKHHQSVSIDSSLYMARGYVLGLLTIQKQLLESCTTTQEQKNICIQEIKNLEQEYTELQKLAQRFPSKAQEVHNIFSQDFLLSFYQELLVAGQHMSFPEIKKVIDKYATHSTDYQYRRALILALEYITVLELLLEKSEDQIHYITYEEQISKELYAYIRERWLG